MHHANLPIKIIIKRYLWRRGRREVEGRGRDRGMERPTTDGVVPGPAAPSRFAPSGCNIRCAKIGKTREEARDVREKVGEGTEGSRSETRIPWVVCGTYMKYIVKLRRKRYTGTPRKGKEDRKRAGGRGTAREDRYARKRERGVRRRRAVRGERETQRLEPKPVITRLPGATAADCYLVSTPTTLSPAILLSRTY